MENGEKKPGGVFFPQTLTLQPLRTVFLILFCQNYTFFGFWRFFLAQKVLFFPLQSPCRLFFLCAFFTPFNGGFFFSVLLNNFMFS